MNNKNNDNTNPNPNKRSKIETISLSSLINNHQEVTTTLENNNAISSMNDNNTSNKNELLLQRAFQYYQDYIENSDTEENDDEEDEDIDCLLEILDLLRLVDLQDENNDDDDVDDSTIIKKTSFTQIIKEITSSFNENENINNINNNNLLLLKENNDNETMKIKKSQETYIKIDTLISILKSMTYLQLASYILSTNITNEDDTTNVNTNANEQKKGMDYLILSLEEWKYNPASLSFLANQYRNNDSNIMKDQHKQQHAIINKKQIANLYNIASQNASTLRSICISILEEDEINEEIKVYIESIILHSCVGAEYLDANDNDDNDDNAQEENDEESCTLVSYSDVEAISSFLSCMMFSMLKEHDIIKKYLLWKFNINFRLHPNVWNTCYYGHDNNDNNNNLDAIDNHNVPMVHTHGIYNNNNNAHDNNMGTILPRAIYNKLCKEIFKPKSLYFQQSNYDQRGYYSFFIPYNNAKSHKIKINNLMEEIIFIYLLPHLLNNNNKFKLNELVGVEWWVHTRSKHCNLGHQLHFDTDEKSLNNTDNKKLLHPFISSVLYLTGGDKAGPTIVLNQKATTKDNNNNNVLGDKLWYNKPKNNTFLTFDGDLLHGALPCHPLNTSDNANNDDNDEHRLTLMVGFWTDPSLSSLNHKIKKTNKKKDEDYVYQPSNPKVPSVNDVHNTWVRQIVTSDYPKIISLPTTTTTTDNKKHNTDTTPKICKCVEPAWENISRKDKELSTKTIVDNNDTNDDDNKHGYPLIIPKIMDHRFFITNENTFHDSLFKDDDDHDDNE